MPERDLEDLGGMELAGSSHRAGSGDLEEPFRDTERKGFEVGEEVLYQGLSYRIIGFPPNEAMAFVVPAGTQDSESTAESVYIQSLQKKG